VGASAATSIPRPSIALLAHDADLA
jgi:hypothetical protein